MRLLERLLGHPWVFDHVRPLAVGGIDMSPAYVSLKTGPDAVVLDVGCGTGDALNYLDHFSSYLGVDTDEVAIRRAQQRFADRSNVQFECRRATHDDFVARPVTHVCMIGLLHHLDDAEAKQLLADVAACPHLVRAVSLDIVYLDGRFYNNLMARLDRGRFCRIPSSYEELVKASGLRIAQRQIVPSHPTRGLVDYFVMSLTP